MASQTPGGQISNVDVVLCGESMKDGNFEGW